MPSPPAPSTRLSPPVEASSVAADSNIDMISDPDPEEVTGTGPSNQEVTQSQPLPVDSPPIETVSNKPVKRFVFRSRKKQPHPGRPRFSSSTSGSSSSFNFSLRGNSSTNENEDFDVLEVIVPERLQVTYGFYVWPCAPILAWYLFEHRHYLPGKRVLELGCGTALPGVLAALCGAQVTLSDSAKLSHCLDQARKTAEVNGVGDKVKVIGLTWGLFLGSLTKLKGQVDLLIGSDCFYEPSEFEDIISTVAYILEHNRAAKFLTTYQERSSNWSIEHLLTKWGLKCTHVPLHELANSNEIDLNSLLQKYTIHLLEITLKTDNRSSNAIQSDDVEFS